MPRLVARRVLGTGPQQPLSAWPSLQRALPSEGHLQLQGDVLQRPGSPNQRSHCRLVLRQSPQATNLGFCDPHVRTDPFLKHDPQPSALLLPSIVWPLRTLRQSSPLPVLSDLSHRTPRRGCERVHEEKSPLPGPLFPSHSPHRTYRPVVIRPTDGLSRPRQSSRSDRGFAPRSTRSLRCLPGRNRARRAPVARTSRRVSRIRR
jgi:hypothetical protein